MIRTFVAAALALVVSAGLGLAGEVKGKFVKYDAEKKVLTLSVDGKDTELTVTEDTKVLNPKGQPVKDSSKAFAKVKPGSVWEATTEKKGDKEVIVELKRGKGK